MNVKPLVHWAIHKQFKLRFSKREPHEVTGILTTPDGQVPFRYEPETRRIHLPDETIEINAHGWEPVQNTSVGSIRIEPFEGQATDFHTALSPRKDQESNDDLQSE
jgi:hypothetical protein